MLDMKWIKDNPEAFDAAMQARSADCKAVDLMALDEARRTHITKLQQAQERRNAASKDIGRAKASGDETGAQALIHEVAELKAFIHEGEEKERAYNAGLSRRLAVLPNIPLEDVPVGADESANTLRYEVGERPELTFTPKQHFELGEALGQMDFSKAGKISGSRFVVLEGALARLERALGQFMLDLHISEHGYREVAPPYLVRPEALFGTGQLPKFEEDSFQTTDGRWLIPTSEVPLTNLVRERMLKEQELPLRFTALTPCFRSEAGAGGRDTRGMLRQHQFSKVELVSITTPDQSRQELERMLACAEEVMKRLGLPYRVQTLSTGDMGFSACKTYDVEAWLPGQGLYREISSCSLCGDFQARRMEARYHTQDGREARFVHTLNGTGVALGRALIAVMENFQRADGSIGIPEVLRPYMGGITRIGQ